MPCRKESKVYWYILARTPAAQAIVYQGRPNCNPAPNFQRVREVWSSSIDYSSQGPGFDTQQLPTFHYLLFHLHKSCSNTLRKSHIPLTWSHPWTGSPSVSCPSTQPVCSGLKFTLTPPPTRQCLTYICGGVYILYWLPFWLLLNPHSRVH